MSADNDDSQRNDKWESHARGRPCVRCSGGIKDCDGKMNTHKREAASLVPDVFSSRAEIIERRTRNDAVAGMERKEPNQSSVESPHSKEAYRPMGHGKANPGNSVRGGIPQKEFGRNRLPMAGRPGYNAGSRDGDQQNVGRTT